MSDVKKIVFFFVFSGICLCLPVGMKRLTHGFHVGKMKLEAQIHSEWEEPFLLDDDQDGLVHILSQPFRYLDKGAQCYVFESEDGRYVIKLFRFDHFRSPIRSFFQTKIRKNDLKIRRFEKISRLFSACKLAYTAAKEETGLLHLHLNPTQNRLPVLSLKGPLGCSFFLPLDAYRFALQKKANSFEKTLWAAIASGNLESHIDSLLHLLVKRAGKGISNSDGNLFRNFGFIGSQAVEMDFGNYGYSRDLLSPLGQRKEIHRFIVILRSWLEDYAPEQVAYLDKKIDQSRVL